MESSGSPVTHQPHFSTPKDLYRALILVWASDTTSPPVSWSPLRSAKNQCSVTSLIFQDYFGGQILSTKTSGATHFYNWIGGLKRDLTDSQFAEPEPYDDTLSSRGVAIYSASHFRTHATPRSGFKSKLEEKIPSSNLFPMSHHRRGKKLDPSRGFYRTPQST